MPQVALERIMIIAGESSGELYGAYLAKALKSAVPGISIKGIGGDRMKDAGVDLIAPIASSFGIVEVIRMFRVLKATFKKAVAALDNFRPQVLVLIDYPDFNLRLAREAGKRGIKVLYYVSPQVWAWRSGRIKKIAALVDRMAVILPFEVDVYRSTGMPVEFVGHPVMDEISEILRGVGYSIDAAGTPALKQAMRERLGLDPSRPVIVVMPGSRHQEVERLYPVFIDAMARTGKLIPSVQFVIPMAPNLGRGLFDRHRLPNDVLLIEGRSIECLAAADGGIIASGTSTLQAALLGVPMVVAYKLSPFSFYIGRRMVKVRYIALANLLLEWSVEHDSGLRIKELIQHEATVEGLAEETVRIMTDSGFRVEMLAQLGRVQALFRSRRPSEHVARIAAALASEGTGLR